MKKLLLAVILGVTVISSACLKGPVIYFAGAAQRSTVIKNHPECIAVRPPSDYVDYFWTDDEYRQQGFDFEVYETDAVPHGYYLAWTRHGMPAGFSTTEDSTVWGSFDCIRF